MLGSAKDFTTASLPDTSSCEVIPSFKEPSSSLSLRLLAFSCLPRQNGSSNLGNFLTRTVFSRFLPDLGVFFKGKEKSILFDAFINLHSKQIYELDLTYPGCTGIRQTSTRKSTSTREITCSTTFTMNS